MLQEAFGENPDNIELLREMVRNPEKLRDYMQAQPQKQGGDEHEWDDDAPDCGDDPFASDAAFEQWQARHGMAHPDEVARVEQLLDNSSLKQLYRKLTMTLHPDREQDLIKREEKTNLMGELSQAWELRDMFTLLHLAHTHLPEADNLLSEENLAAINPALWQKKRELEICFFRGPEGVQGAILHKFKQRDRSRV